jgi:hypothetical protein
VKAYDRALSRCRLLTTTNKMRVEDLVGKDYHVYEVVGKAEDLDAIVRATKEASRARETR